MSTFHNFILIVILVLVIAQSGIILLLAKFMGDFLNKIKSIKGIEFEGLSLGQDAPLFRGIDYKGRKIIFKKLYEQKNVLLLFINSNCSTCKQILPYLNKITSNYNITVVLINTDINSDDKWIQSQLPENLIYLRSEQIGQPYFIKRVPYAYVVNKEGKIEQQKNIANFNELWNMILNQDQLVS